MARRFLEQDDRVRHAHDFRTGIVTQTFNHGPAVKVQWTHNGDGSPCALVGSVTEEERNLILLTPEEIDVLRVMSR